MSTPPAFRTGNRPRPHALRRSVVALTAAGVLLGGTAAAAHAAGPYAEVVTRAWGVDGAQPAIPFGSPGAVSNDGRWSAFSSNPNVREPEWDGFNVAPPDSYLYVRDIVDNRTFQVTSSGFGFASSFDDAGRFLTYTTFPNPGLGQSGSAPTKLWVVDTTTNASTLVGRATGANGAAATQASGIVSGDGKSVVFTAADVPGSGPGIYRRTLATNTTTRLGDLPGGAAPNPDGSAPLPQAVRSISKNGFVVTLDEIRDQTTYGNGLIITPTKRIQVKGSPVVSADGSTVAYLENGVNDAPERLVVRSVPTGVEASYPAPAGAGNGDGTVSWVSADGKQVVVAPDTPFSIGGAPPTPYDAQLFDRSSGTWSPAGPFAKAFRSPTVGGIGLFSTTAYSRNGRYSLWASRNGTLVGDNHGAALPGGADHPPANSYFDGPDRYCKGETATSVTSHLTPNYLEPVKSLVGEVTIDGNYGGEDTFTTDRTTEIPLPADAKTVTIKATVTFLNGEKATGTYEYGVHNSPFC